MRQWQDKQKSECLHIYISFNIEHKQTAHQHREECNKITVQLQTQKCAQWL
jgi:hypothetical protein